MDIDRIRYFHVFAETGSIAKACELLQISPSALSKAIKTLEAEVGFSLVEADGRGLKVTSQGMTLKTETTELLKKWDSIPSLIQKECSNEILKFASFEVFTTYFLSELSEYLRNIKFEIHEYVPEMIENAILDKRVDFGITLKPFPKKGVSFEEVTKVEFNVFGAKKYADQENFETLPFVAPLSPYQDHSSKLASIDSWPDKRFERRVVSRVMMMESGLELCRSGHCVAYLPKFVVDIHNREVRDEFKLFSIPNPLEKENRIKSVYMLYRDGEKINEVYNDFREVISKLS